MFTDRSTHPWPPVVPLSRHPDRLWNALVADTDSSINSFPDAAQRVNTLIAAIDGAT